MAIQTSTPAAEAARALSKEEIQRYSRHLIMPEVGMDGQLKLARAKVLMIGAGGLGAPLGLYLAAAGVGRLGIVDFDMVDFTNLQRQITFTTQDVGRPKAEAAQERLSAMNPTIRIDTYRTMLTSANALELFRDYDIIVDGTDNFPTRYLVNDACVLIGQAERLRLDLPLRGPGHGLRLSRRAVLPLPVSGAASAGAGAVVRRGRRAGRAAGHRRLDSGHGDDQADPGHRRAARRPSAAVRRAGHDASSEYRLRKNPDCPICGEHRTINQADRLRGILRNSRRGGSYHDHGNTGNYSARAEGAAGSRRRSVHSGRARAARIPDLQAQ